MNRNRKLNDHRLSALIKRIRFKEVPFDKEQTFQRLLLKIEEGAVAPLVPEEREITVDNTYKRVWQYGSVAAMVALLVGGWFLYNNVYEQSGMDKYVASIEEPTYESEHVQLIISNQEVVQIEDTAATIQYSDSGLVHVNAKPLATTVAANTNKIEAQQEYNQLVVPYGRTSSVVFSDGTKAWVNAGSRMIYPIVFSGTKREIFVEGEVYLEVAHNEHKPFIVKTNRMDVRVLGTCFNVNAYKSNRQDQIVLVEGRVEVETDRNQKRVLLPSEMLSYDGQKEPGVRRVDVNNYTAWKEGFYQFHSESLAMVIERISKYYGAKIEYDKTLGQLTCTGKLFLKDTVEGVLRNLEKAASITVKIEPERIYIDVEP